MNLASRSAFFEIFSILVLSTKSLVPKNYQWHKTIQFKDAVWVGMIIFIKQFTQNLKNDIITIIVNAHIHQGKNTCGLDAPSDKKLRR